MDIIQFHMPSISVGSMQFFILLAFVAVAFQLAPRRLPKQALLIAANAAFLYPFLDNIPSWIGLAAFVLIGYAAIRFSQIRLRGLGFTLLLASLVIAFLLVKKYTFLEAFVPSDVLTHPIQIIGISYMLFKLIHMLVDTWQGDIKQVRFITYVNYQLSFFTLVAGPIQRYREFAGFWESIGESLPGRREAMLAWSRILTGMLKMALFGAFALRMYQFASELAPSTDSRLMAAAGLAVMFYAYPAFIYFNFSGYTDIVVGAAKLFGLTLPENFNRPYLARNMVDFWNRWHITLSIWIRDYVFMTSYKWVATKWAPYARRLGYVLAFAALFIAGIWHGSTWNFVIFGVVHGAGVAGSQIYGQTLRQVIKPSGVQAYMRNRWITGVAMLVTFHYVCLAFLFFPQDLGRTTSIVSRAFNTVIGGA